MVDFVMKVSFFPAGCIYVMGVRGGNNLKGLLWETDGGCILLQK